jgi:hypothetical protein
MRNIALTAVATIVLAACAGLAEDAGTGQSGSKPPRETRVMVDKDLLWIDQEPIIVRGKDVTLTWRITTKGYEFPNDGIVFQDPSQFVKCVAKATIFQCVDTNSASGRFKYTIKVERSGGKDHPQPLDPFVVNDR